MRAKPIILAIVISGGLVYAQNPGAAATNQAQAAAAQAKRDPMAKPESKDAGKQASAAKPATRTGSRRDPFVSPVVARMGGGGAVACTPAGKRCLAADHVVVKGIVRSQDQAIAVVEDAGKKSYFLRENDAILNGFVLKITGDAVVFRENALDNMGRVVSREVVKRVNAPRA